MSTHLTAATLAKLEELAASGAAPAISGWLRRTLGEGSDFDCYKINAFRVAQQTGVSRVDATRSFLFATRLGLIDLTWDIHCPSCKGLPDYHRHLMQLEQRAHCSLCQLKWDVDLSEQVEVTFTVNPDARAISVVDFKDLVFPQHVQYFEDMHSREGRHPVLVLLMLPGETKSADVELAAGGYRIEVPGYPESGLTLELSGPPAPAVQVVSFSVAPTGALAPRTVSLTPGRVRVTGTNQGMQPWPLAIYSTEPLKNWVSAAYVTALQDFRDLFADEFLAADVSFAVKSTTLMFTDIKGSTEMYERLGDARAYAVVQEHFRLMTEVIRRWEGGVVKTIGDAVMASFPVNASAVGAALEIQDGFAKAGVPLDEVEVKIGLHRGPAIAVTSNRMLDFFGRTVNIAARVQGESKPREVLLTETVLNDADVGVLFAKRKLSPTGFDATLKGIAGQARLYSTGAVR